MQYCCISQGPYCAVLVQEAAACQARLAAAAQRLLAQERAKNARLTACMRRLLAEAPDLQQELAAAQAVRDRDMHARLTAQMVRTCIGFRVQGLVLGWVHQAGFVIGWQKLPARCFIAL